MTEKGPKTLIKPHETHPQNNKKNAISHESEISSAHLSFDKSMSMTLERGETPIVYYSV